MKYIIHDLTDYFSVLGQASNYTGASLDAEVAKAQELLRAESVQFGKISGSFNTAAEGSTDIEEAKAQFEAASGTAGRLSVALQNMSAKALGMFFEPLSQSAIEAYTLPENWSDILPVLLYSVLADRGITEQNYATERLIWNQDIQTLQNTISGWKTASTASQTAAAAYSNTFALPEGTIDAVTGLGALLRALYAAYSGGSVIAITAPLVGWLTGVPLTLAAASGAVAIEAIDEGSQWWAGPDGRRADAIFDATGVKLAFPTSTGNVNIGIVGSAVFVSGRNASALNFDISELESAADQVVIVGSTGVDTIKIGNLSLGNVLVASDAGADVIKIGTPDVLSPADVKIDSGADGDTIEIRAGNAEIKTGAGEDTVSLISGGTFEVDAGGDKDTIRIGDIGNSTIKGGAGEDTVDFSGQNIEGVNPVVSGIKFDLSQQSQGLVVTQGNSTLTLIGIEKFILTEFKDVVKGDNQANTFDGLDGDDTLIGGSGRDVLLGGLGNDTLVGGSDFDADGKPLERSGTSQSVYDSVGDRLEGGQGDDKYYTNRFLKLPFGNNLTPFTSYTTILEALGIRNRGFQGPPAPYASLALAGMDVISDSDNQGTIYSDLKEIPTVTFERFVPEGGGAVQYWGRTGEDADFGGNPWARIGATAYGNGFIFFNDYGEILFIVENISAPQTLARFATLSASASTSEPSSLLGFRFLDRMTEVTLTDAADIYSGTDADDFVKASSGDDVIDGARGNDVIFGGAGNDSISGGDGYDDLRGEAGDDALFGGDGRDQLNGGTGNDNLWGGSGNDALTGEAGEDAITGDAGNDNILGGDGNDILNAGLGNDSVSGGNGNDKYDFAKGDGQDSVDENGSDGDVDNLYLHNFTFSDLYFSRVTTSSNDLLITFKNSGDSIRIVDGLSNLTRNTIENIVFDDGTVFSLTGISSVVTNIGPKATADVFATSEGSKLILTQSQLTANDTDANSDPLVVTSIGNARSCNAFIRADGQIEVTPIAGFFGRASFEYTISDGLGGTSTAKVEVNIAEKEVSPIAVDDGLALQGRAASVILASALLGNDIDANADTLVIKAVTSVSNCVVTLLTNGNIQFSASQGFSGEAVFTYTVTDRRVGTSDSTATVRVNVEQVNNAPVIASLLVDVSSPEDGEVSITLPANSFTDVDGDTLTYRASLADGSGLPAWLTVNATTGALSGTPPLNFNGVLDVRLTASDGTASVSDVFTLTVIAVNDAPVVSVSIPDTSSLEDQAVNFALPANTFFDVDGNALTLTATLSNGDALPSWLSFNATTGAFTGTPPLNLNGSLSVKVTASDGELSAYDTFSLAITPVNDAPVIATLLPDRSSAEDNAALTYSATLANGLALPTWLTFNAATQTFSGTPPLNFNGSLDVKVVASDGALSASDVFALSITSVNDAPVVAQLLADVSSAEDTAISFILPVNAFSDVDNTSLSYSAILASGAALPSWLSFNAATRQFSGTPPLNFFGSLDVKVTASDGALAASDVFTLNITPVNDAPVAVNDGPLAVTFNTALTITAASLLANDSDVDGNALSITGVQAGVNGNVALNSLGNIVFTPTAGFSGSASFTYTLSDGNGASSTATVALSVSSGSNIINGTAGSNILFGTAANDIINALAGDDIVVAGDGNDTIYAGSGTDLVEAGNGNDLIYGEAGTDIIYGNDGDDIAYGGDGDDFVIGANGNDTIYGDLGNDSLQGDAGNDLIYGGAGADTMYGGSGNDVLSGQAGNDIMSGDTGNDRFVFTAGFGKDRITDFQAGSTVSDIIQLSLGTSFDTFAEVMAATTNVQGNAVITISSSDTITLVGVTKSMLVENDFLFT
jgi:Ca2+-binding RTX toxin-like protein